MRSICPRWSQGAKYRGEFEERLRAVMKEIIDAERRRSSRSSMSSTRSSVLERPKERWMPETSSNRCLPEASSALLARTRRSVSTASTLNPTPHWNGDSSRCLSAPPSVQDTVAILRGLKERYEVHHGVRIQDAAPVAAACLVGSLCHWPLPPRQGDRPDRWRSEQAA